MTKEVIIREKKDSYRLGQSIETKRYEIEGNSPFVESIKEL